MASGGVIALLAGILSLGAWVVTVTGVTGGAVGMLAAIPLYLVGFAYGAAAGAIASSAAVIVAVGVGGTLLAGSFGLMHALPAWIVIRQAIVKRRVAGSGAKPAWVPPGRILVSLSVTAASLIAVIGLAVLSEGKTLEDVMVEQFGLALDKLESLLTAGGPGAGGSELPPGWQGVIADTVVPILPGASSIVWLLTAVTNACIAQWLLRRSGKNLRPSPAYSQIALPGWFGWVFFAAATLSLIGPANLEYMARNIALVLALPYFLVGLAVVHVRARRLNKPVIWLTLFYLVMLFTGLTPVIATVLAAVGMVEQWSGWNFREDGSGSAPQPANDEHDELDDASEDAHDDRPGGPDDKKD